MSPGVMHRLENILNLVKIYVVTLKMTKPRVSGGRQREVYHKIIAVCSIEYRFHKGDHPG